MFRRLLVLTCALAVVGALSWGANAAPISGSFGVEVTFYPVGQGGNPLDPRKIDFINVKFEADLILTLSVSGVDITSTTVFTFRGLEFQSFVIMATVGALTIRDTIIFSPTFFEFEELRTAVGSLRYCVRNSFPSVAGTNASCFFPSYPNLGAGITDTVFGTKGFSSILGSHSVVQNLIFARWLESIGGLGNDIVFRKKIADLSLNIAGLVLNVKALFANVASTGFSLLSGLVLSMDGKTVSGVGVRGELWLGAKQGFECFGECKPLERFFNSMVTGGGLGNTEEEKLFLTNVVLFGVRHDLRVEMHFDLTQCTMDQVDSNGNGWIGEPGDPINIVSPICFVQLVQSGTIAPWRLDFRQVWNFNGVFDLMSASTRLTLRVGEMATTATFIWWQNNTLSFSPFLADISSTFDPPGVQVTSFIELCIDPFACAAPVVFHILSFTGTVGPVSIAATATFLGGVFGTFNELDVDLSFSAGNMDFISSTILLTDRLGGQRFSLGIKF
jgi:hypothetical protein